MQSYDPPASHQEMRATPQPPNRPEPRDSDDPPIRAGGSSALNTSSSPHQRPKWLFPIVILVCSLFMAQVYVRRSQRATAKHNPPQKFDVLLPALLSRSKQRRSPLYSTLTLPSNNMRYLLSGSFASTSLYLLAFSSANQSLEVVKEIPAKGPHQFLGVNARRDRVYLTSWSLPPTLSAWKVDQSSGQTPVVEMINEVPINATSSYTYVTESAVYSVGGPTGEIHAIDPKTGGFGEKIQDLLYVPAERLAEEDKTRVALRYGSHAIEISSLGHAFVPHLGQNAIYTYLHDPATSRLTPLSVTPSPRPQDGPRHLFPHPSGAYLYSITEHTQFLDIFEVIPQTGALKWVQSISVIPEGADPALYRGDTVRFSPWSGLVVATTRGATPEQKGSMLFLSLTPKGLPDSQIAPVIWETPTSGGKANAIEFSPFHRPVPSQDRGEFIVLTDEAEGQGFVYILEWRTRASGPGGANDPGRRKTRGEVKLVASTKVGDGKGASHAIWL